nr:hypothetical protein [Tanacetum cinerariifolium]
MHNNIIAAGSRDRPPMLAPGRYPQWRSRFLPYVDTRPNGEALRKCILSVETPTNMSPENKAHFLAEKEAIHLILTGIGDDIYLTVDACQTAQEMWEAIERLVPSCFVIFDLEPLSLSFDFIFSSEIFKSLSFNIDLLCHLAILCLDHYAHTLHHLKSLPTIYLDRLDILKEDFVYQSLRNVNSILVCIIPLSHSSSSYLRTAISNYGVSLGESSHWQYKFPLPVKGVPTARRIEIPLPGVCIAMMKKLPVKDR